MPFITEELWNAMDGRGDYPLITAKWPEPQAQVDPHAKAELAWLIELVTSIRSGRTELNVPPATIAPLRMGGRSKGIALERVVNNRATLKRLARVEYGGFGPLERSNDFSKAHWDDLAAKYAEEVEKGSLFVSAQDFEGFIPLAGIIDLEAEKARLSKGAEAAEKERDSLAQRLANANFTERAKPEAVDKARADHESKAAEAQRLRAALERLG
jgi:valyl-tRNA synthetase